MLQTYRDPPYGLPVAMKSTSILLDEETRADIAVISKHFRVKAAPAIRLAIAQVAREIRASSPESTPRPRRKS